MKNIAVDIHKGKPGIHSFNIYYLPNVMSFDFPRRTFQAWERIPKNTCFPQVKCIKVLN